MTDWALELERLTGALGRPPVAPEAAAALGRWLDLLASWSARTDLTGARTPEAMVEVMVGDALVLAELLPPDASVLDVGAGAGGPTLPLALLRPDLRATLLEPRARRVAFLRTSVGALELVARVRVVDGKLDERRPAAPPGALGPPDVALSRATFAPEVWLPLGLAVAPRVVVLSTGPLPAPDAGARLEAERSYRVPSSGAARWAGLFARTG